MDNDYELLYLAKEDIENITNVLLNKYNNLLYSKVLKYSTSNLDFEEYFNEARMSLCDSVEYYNDKYPFVSYLNTCVERRLLNYKKKTNRNKHKILNESLSTDNEIVESYHKIRDDKYNPEKVLLSELDYEFLKGKIIEKLTWKEELIFELKQQNYTNKEISEITDNHLRTVYNIIRRIQNKVSKILST